MGRGSSPRDLLLGNKQINSVRDARIEEFQILIESLEIHRLKDDTKLVLDILNTLGFRNTRKEIVDFLKDPVVSCYAQCALGQFFRPDFFEDDEALRTYDSKTDWLGSETEEGIGTVCLGGREYHYGLLQQIFFPTYKKREFGREPDAPLESISDRMVFRPGRFAEGRFRENLLALKEDGYLEDAGDEYMVTEKLAALWPFFFENYLQATY